MTRRQSAGSAARKKKADLRIIHVINGLGPGGAETVLFRLVTHGGPIQHEVISLEPRDWYSQQLEKAGITVHHLSWSRAAVVAATRRLHHLIRNSDADVVQAWMYRSNLVAGLSARVAGKPVVWNIRCSSLDPLRLSSRLLAYAGGALARWVPRFVINCSAQSVGIHARLGYGAVAGTVIPNGYDARVFTMDESARSTTRAELGLDPDTFVIGTIARWHAQKGFPLLLDALRLLAQRNVPARLLLIGRGLDDENRDLSALVAASGCADYVQLLGQRGDVPDIARALDVHVLASVGSEGFPNVVAETMLSGTPNIATDVGDAAFIVGDTGWVVEPGDAARLADAITAAYREWQSAPDAWLRRRKGARARIADNFSLDRMAKAYEQVWRQVAGNRA